MDHSADTLEGGAPLQNVELRCFFWKLIWNEICVTTHSIVAIVARLGITCRMFSVRWLYVPACLDVSGLENQCTDRVRLRSRAKKHTFLSKKVNIISYALVQFFLPVTHQEEYHWFIMVVTCLFLRKNGFFLISFFNYYFLLNTTGHGHVGTCWSNTLHCSSTLQHGWTAPVKDTLSGHVVRLWL